MCWLRKRERESSRNCTRHVFEYGSVVEIIDGLYFAIVGSSPSVVPIIAITSIIVIIIVVVLYS